MRSRPFLSFAAGNLALMPSTVFGAISPTNLTTGGFTCQPLAVHSINQNRLVDKRKFKPRQILQQNVKALLDSGLGPTSQLALSRKLGGKGNATIGRIVGAQGENTKLEKISAIAEVYGLEAWQLLVAGMDPKNPPVLAPVTKEEKEFWTRLRSLYEEVGKGPPQK